MPKIVRWVLIVAFLLAVALVLIPSALLLVNTAADDVKAMPTPPATPAFLSMPPPTDTLQARAEYNEKEAAKYKLESEAYIQRMGAYKSYADAAQQSHATSVYTLVVKDVLLTFLSTFSAATVLGYLFVKGGANIIENALRIRNNIETKSFTLF